MYRGKFRRKKKISYQFVVAYSGICIGNDDVYYVHQEEQRQEEEDPLDTFYIAYRTRLLSVSL